MASKSRFATLSWTEKLVIAWFLLDGITHLLLEASYLVLSFAGGAKYHTGFWAFVWNEYSKADFRWNVRDANVMSLELVTVLLWGPMCLWLAYAILYRKAYRHLLQIIVSVGELYGGTVVVLFERV